MKRTFSQRKQTKKEKTNIMKKGEQWKTKVRNEGKNLNMKKTNKINENTRRTKKIDRSNVQRLLLMTATTTLNGLARSFCRVLVISIKNQYGPHIAITPFCSLFNT